MSLSPESRMSLIIEYMDGDLTDDLLCAKYGITDIQLETVVHIGTGNIINPEPLTRGKKRGIRNACAVGELARQVLPPADMAVSPLQSAEVIDHDARVAGLYLNTQELEFANMVLRGMKPVAAAAAAFELFNEHLANRKAAELLRASHVSEYLSQMKGRSLFAPVRNKAYLEAVLWQVIDRGLELKQKFNPLTGQPVDGVCEYNWKAVVAAGTLLARIKGYDKAEQQQNENETQRDRLRRIQANYHQQLKDGTQ